MANAYINLPKATDQLSHQLWRSVKILDSGCWIWTGKGRTEKGYGMFMHQRQRLRAHRVAYYIYYGIDPQELSVCHVCDNPPCCNPLHLFAGTHRDNMTDKISKGRHILGTHSASAKLNPVSVRRIRQLWATGEYTQTQIGEMMGVHRGTVLQVIHRRTWAHVEGYEIPLLSRKEGNARAALHRCGERSPKSKLTEDDVREIRRLRKEGLTTTQISELITQVTYDAIWKIVRGHNWKRLN
jgi:hypothetical protein